MLLKLRTPWLSFLFIFSSLLFSQNITLQQNPAVDYLSFGAEHYHHLENPDACNDVTLSSPPAGLETPAQNWAALLSLDAITGEVLMAPAGPHGSRDADYQEGIAVYELSFWTPGDYYLHYRSSNNGVSGNHSSDSFFVSNYLGDPTPTRSLTTPDAGSLEWRVSSFTYTITEHDLGKPLRFLMGVREKSARVDAFVFSTQTSLDDGERNALFAAPTMYTPSSSGITHDRSHLDLNWDGPLGQPTQVTVYYGRSDAGTGSWEDMISLEATTESSASLTLKHLLANETYYVKVKAVSRWGDSWSATHSFDTANRVNYQIQGRDHLIVQAEHFDTSINNDADNDHIASGYRGTAESPQQSWQVVADPDAKGGEALVAPPWPHTTTDPTEPEAQVNYAVIFRRAGTYHLYYRARNNGTPDHSGSNSFFAATSFSGEPTDYQNVNRTGDYGWNTDGHTFRVETADLGQIKYFSLGVRESDTHLDTLIFSTNANLSDATLDHLAGGAIVQQEHLDHIAFEAEDYWRMDNPDAANDIQMNPTTGIPDWTGLPEDPAQVWTTQEDAYASGGRVLKAPDAPHQTESMHRAEAVAVYQLVFKSAGTYQLHVRGRNNGTRNDGLTDSFYIMQDLDDLTTLTNWTGGAGKSGYYQWRTNSLHNFTVEPGQVGSPLFLRIGSREPSTHLDAFALVKTSETPSEAELDSMAAGDTDLLLRATVDTYAGIFNKPLGTGVVTDATLYWDTEDMGTGSWSNSMPLDPSGLTWITGLAPETVYFARQRVSLSTGEVLWSPRALIFTTTALKTHPRLLFDDVELGQMRARGHDLTELQAYCAKILDDLPAPGAPLPTNLWSIRHYEDWLLSLGMAELLDPSNDHDDEMMNLFDGMLNFPEWNADCPSDLSELGDDLEVTHNLRGLALFFDWFYDRFTPAQRVDIQEKLAAAMKAHMDCFGTIHSDVPAKFMTNHPSNGYGALAALIYGLDILPRGVRDHWQQLLDLRFQQVNELTHTELDDGSGHEGPYYDSYNLEQTLLWFEIQARGENIPVHRRYASLAFFRNTPNYYHHIGLPGRQNPDGSWQLNGGLPRYGDSHAKAFSDRGNYLMTLFAAYLGDPKAQWLANNLNPDDYDADTAYYFDGYHYWPFIYKDDTVAETDPTTGVNWSLFHKSGYFTWRSGYDGDDVYFTKRSGTHFSGHTQPDDGQFLIYRAAIPYIADLGYEYGQVAAYHNVLLLDGQGQNGDGTGSDPEPFGTWPDINQPKGQYDFILADGEEGLNGQFFNVIANPTGTYVGTPLTNWQRETVKAGDFFLVRDTILTDDSANLELRFHAYQSEPVTDTNRPPTWTYSNTREETAISTYSGGPDWIIQARCGEPAMFMSDLSEQSWTSSIELTTYENGGTQRLGDRLLRNISTVAGDERSSLMGFYFSDHVGVDPFVWSGSSCTETMPTVTWTIDPWPLADAEGMIASDSTGPRVEVFWPHGSGVTNSNGWDHSGAMGGRIHARSGTALPAYFARETTQFASHGGQTLLTSTEPVSVYAQVEHTATPSEPHVLWMVAEQCANISLFYPGISGSSVQLLVNDVTIIHASYDASTSLLSFSLPTSSQPQKLALMP